MKHLTKLPVNIRFSITHDKDKPIPEKFIYKKIKDIIGKFLKDENKISSETYKALRSIFYQINAGLEKELYEGYFEYDDFVIGDFKFSKYMNETGISVQVDIFNEHHEEYCFVDSIPIEIYTRNDWTVCNVKTHICKKEIDTKANAVLFIDFEKIFSSQVRYNLTYNLYKKEVTQNVG